MPSQDPTRPNILFVLTDDQGCWAMGCAGNHEMRTPNLDRLADAGIRFDQFFCASPVCSPARASILTGRIPSQHGIHDWLRAGNSTCEPEKGGRLTEYLQGQLAYTELLAAQGYVCGLSGKWHLGDAHHAQKGFTFWEVHAKGGGPYYGAPMIQNGQVVEPPQYVTDLITDNALRFLRAQAGCAAPFYLSVHYTAPHSPWGRDDHPADLYGAYFDTCPFDSIPFEPMHPWQVNSAPHAYTVDGRRALLSGYFAAVTAMDAGVGRLLDWLCENGLIENTLVIFTGDNGMNMGHHGIFGKGNGTFPQNMFDTSVKVPALIAHPARVPAGLVNQDLLSHYDIMPTLLDYLGIENPAAAGLPGASFAPLLQGAGLSGPAAKRESIVVANDGAAFAEYGPVRMIRSREWKYVHRYPYGPHELYDLVHDPDERQNLIDSPTHQSTAQHMKAGLESWFIRYVDPAFDGRVEPVTGKGQLGLAGPAGQGEDNFAADWTYIRERQ
ncbi:MAG: sulfatase-like hydrolase/transferase [Anaerolineae bacterium]|nr:sulfatase-like hydrolase/transferase [Anaerolineae bacterium]